MVVPSSPPPLLAEPSSLACAVASRARGRRAVRESRHVSSVASSHAAAVLLAAAPSLEEEGSPVLSLTEPSPSRGSAKRERTGVREEEGERSEAETVPVTAVCLCHYRPASPRCLAGASVTIVGVLRPPEPPPELLAAFAVAGKVYR
ncbi:uncharacterized protein DS421_19g657430 [Arachis hypogaea]|uniref:Uncharacterized protein n=1 Tax=Arachis hypogaea TaxID=3818 RepID=A0A6B9V9Q3_ARAHY|nr:uncharacterized protein DS421_19g657430 [Arachis hypogaea]